MPLRDATCFRPDTSPTVNIQHRFTGRQYHAAVGFVPYLANLPIAPAIHGQSSSSTVFHRHAESPPLPSKQRGDAPGYRTSDCRDLRITTKHVYVHSVDYPICASLTTPVGKWSPLIRIVSQTRQGFLVPPRYQQRRRGLHGFDHPPMMNRPVNLTRTIRGLVLSDLESAQGAALAHTNAIAMHQDTESSTGESHCHVAYSLISLPDQHPLYGFPLTVALIDPPINA